MIAFLKNLAPIIFYLGFIGAAIASLTGNVRLGLYFLVPLLPLQNVVNKLHDFPLGKDFNDILLLCMIFGWFISKASKSGRLLAKTSFTGILFLYLIFTYITLWMGSQFLHDAPPINPADPRVQLWKNYMILPLLFFITMNNIRDVKDMRNMMVVMCASMFLMNYYNVQQVADMTSWVNRTKISGTFVDLGANEVASFYATYTFVLMGLLFYIKEKKEKLGLLILIGTNFFIVLFMFSRAAYMATAAAFIFISFMKNKALLIIPLVLALFWTTLLPKDVINRVTFSENEGELDDSAATRLVLWQQSIAYFQESPIIGIGFNVFGKIGLRKDAHNVFMRTLAEQGMVGFLFLITIMLLAMSRSWRLYRRARDPFLKGLGLGFCACVISNMISNFFGDRWTPLQLAAYYWVFLGMVERGNLIVNEQLVPVQKKVKTETPKRERYRR